MLNSHGENGHPCLVPNIKGKNTQSLTIRYDVNCGVFVNVLDPVEKVSLYS